MTGQLIRYLTITRLNDDLSRLITGLYIALAKKAFNRLKYAIDTQGGKLLELTSKEPKCNSISCFNRITIPCNTCIRCRITPRWIVHNNGGLKRWALLVNGRFGYNQHGPLCSRCAKLYANYSDEEILLYLNEN